MVESFEPLEMDTLVPVQYKTVSVKRESFPKDKKFPFGNQFMCIIFESASSKAITYIK